MAVSEEMPPPRQPRGAPDLGARESPPSRDSGGSVSQQGNQGSNQGKGGINWMVVAVVLFVLYQLFGQGNLAANTWATTQVAGAVQQQGAVLGDLTKGMGLMADKLGQVSNNMAVLSQNQVSLFDRMGKVEAKVGTLETTVNQQTNVLGTVNANLLSLQQVQQQTNALLLSLGNGSDARPANSNIMGQMFNGTVPTQLGGMALPPSNGVAGVFPGAQPQASNPLYGEPNVTFTAPGGQPQTTIDANGEMHVVDPFGRVGVQPGGQP